jgi:hypothetical protein
MSVRRAQREISSAEFAEWAAYYALEPFGDRVADVRAGTITAVLANVHKSKNTPVYGPLDFYTWTKEPDKPEQAPTPEAVALVGFGINLAELRANGQKTVVLKGRSRDGG